MLYFGIDNTNELKFGYIVMNVIQNFELMNSIQINLLFETTDRKV